MAKLPESPVYIAGFHFVRSSAAAADRGVPYWASLRVNEVNMRVGPGEDYRISWVYRRQQLPLKVIRLKEGWRLVEDPGGTRGWVLAQFLTRSAARSLSAQAPAEMREKPAMRTPAAVAVDAGRGRQAGRLHCGLVPHRCRRAGRICRAGPAVGGRGALSRDSPNPNSLFCVRLDLCHRALGIGCGEAAVGTRRAERIAFLRPLLGRDAGLAVGRSPICPLR